MERPRFEKNFTEAIAHRYVEPHAAGRVCCGKLVPGQILNRNFRFQATVVNLQALDRNPGGTCRGERGDTRFFPSFLFCGC
jgi:hypothetical protein